MGVTNKEAQNMEREFDVKITQVIYKAVTVKVKAKDKHEAQDKGADLFYQDDGSLGIREKMEFDGTLLDVKVVDK